MRIQFTVLPNHIGGQTWADGTIEINTDSKHPNRIRYMVSSFVHELCHLVLSWWGGFPSNPYECYCQEIWCYRVQWLAEKAMHMSRIVDIEGGPIMSVAIMIGRMKSR